MNLKKFLKTIKLNESTISMVLGALVIIVVGSLVVKYLKNTKGVVPQELLNGDNSIELTQKVHTVSKGDNLWNIAVKYYGNGFKWVDIATENKLTNASIIEDGQKLVIPELEKNNISVEEDNSNTISENTYVVIKGDTLWDIAVRNYGDGYKWVEIAKVNNLSHPDLIHSGNSLVLPK